MPRSQGTSRKGKPKKADRVAGLGRALQKAQGYNKNKSQRSGTGGMAMLPQENDGGLTGGAERGGDVAAVPRSVLEMHDLEDFLQQADLAQREFLSERQEVVVLDANAHTYRPASVTFADEPNKNKPEFRFKELSVPRRPAWDESTSPAELERLEQEAFLNWRRSIALQEEELMRLATASSSLSPSSTVATPFEKNIQVWRQLWRVLERSSCLVQLVDARNPLFYLSEDLRDYAQSLGKPMMVLINKSDFLSAKQREAWHTYLRDVRGWETTVFFSAALEQEKIDRAVQRERRQEQEALQASPLRDDGPENNDDDAEEEEEEEEDESTTSTGDSSEEKDDLVESKDGIGIERPLTRRQLMHAMLEFAQKHQCEPDPRYDHRIQFGMVGFPNVGKSSVINVLVGSSKQKHGVVRVAVAAQPGKTKHFQTLMVPDADNLMLCDCPGLVFPSFVSNTADLIAAGVYPIAQMRDHKPVMHLVCQRIPREILNAQYAIQLPAPSAQELRELSYRTKPEHGAEDSAHSSLTVPPPSADEFLTTLCNTRGMLSASSGAPDYTRASRMVIKDYATGKLLYCHPPPNLTDKASFYRETVGTALRNTKKLRDKLDPMHSIEEGLDFAKDKVHGSVTENEAAESEAALDDSFFVLLQGTPGESPRASVAKNTKKKWGKKNRKNRNNDPYGCHSTPGDSVLFDGGSAAPSGVVVNAGKYGRSGYTRPTGFGASRSSLQLGK